VQSLLLSPHRRGLSGEDCTNTMSKENSPNSFHWVGSIPILIYGKHQFDFTPSEQTPRGTTFVNKEEFSGALVVLFKPFLGTLGGSSENFDTLNRELKEAAESKARGK
jgi:hypothetical protein